MYLAAYKGKHKGLQGVMDRLGRALDDGIYIHVELLGIDGLSRSSSYIDKGVRTKFIGYSTPDAWDFLELPDYLFDKTKTWFDIHDGKPYDIMGNIRFFNGFVRHTDGEWFCSESIGAACGLTKPHLLGPNGLWYMLKDIYGGNILHHRKEIYLPEPRSNFSNNLILT